MPKVGTSGYDDLYRARTWAYGDRPDAQFIRALVDHPRGRALDLGGGQGRHALALSALGFDVTLIDTSAEGLHQAAAAAEQRSLPVHILQGDASKFEPDGEYEVVVAALFFQHLAHRTALQFAKRLGTALSSGGLFYVSLPGYSKQTHAFAAELIEEAGCSAAWIEKHLVTKQDRPKLQAPRRNETFALGRARSRR